MLCMCTLAGQEEFFLAVGFPIDSRTSPPLEIPLLLATLRSAQLMAFLTGLSLLCRLQVKPQVVKSCPSFPGWFSQP